MSKNRSARARQKQQNEKAPISEFSCPIGNTVISDSSPSSFGLKLIYAAGGHLLVAHKDPIVSTLTAISQDGIMYEIKITEGLFKQSEEMEKNSKMRDTHHNVVYMDSPNPFRMMDTRYMLTLTFVMLANMLQGKTHRDSVCVAINKGDYASMKHFTNYIIIQKVGEYSKNKAA